MTTDPDGTVTAERLAARLRLLALQRQEAWLDSDLTMRQLRVLFEVRRRQPVSVSDLARVLGQRLPAASALVGRLDRAGLLRRCEDTADRRRTLVRLSEQAEGMLHTADARSAERFAALLARMSPQGRQALATALDELVGLLTAPTGRDEED